MADYKAVEQIEGPYWDFSARCDYLHSRRYAAASNAAEYLNSGDLEWALRHAKTYKELSDALDRCSARFGAVRKLDYKWIGWRSGV